MREMYFTGSIALIIYDFHLSELDMNEALGFDATKIIDKEQAEILKSPCSIWIYELELTDLNFATNLALFTQHLLN